MLFFQKLWLAGLRPTWAAWTAEDCEPRCYNHPDEIKVSRKRFIRICTPNYRQVECNGESFKYEFGLCANIPRCPEPDRLDSIVLKNSYLAKYSTDDHMYVRICNPEKCCENELDNSANNFEEDETDVFDKDDLTAYGHGDCFSFNITSLTSLEVKRRPYDDPEPWLGDYIDLSSWKMGYLVRHRYRCHFNEVWIPADSSWYPINCVPINY